jgi:toxin ParE1/3/4
MKLRFSPKAEIDLEDIGDYIARENPARALTFLNELRATCLAIASTPPPAPSFGPGSGEQCTATI